MITVLFVPGFKEDIHSRNYTNLVKAIEEKGYKVRFVSIKWTGTSIDDWVAELDDVYLKYDPKKVILAGFSYGSMTAFISATQHNPLELWLFSFSPYFSENMSMIKKVWLAYAGFKRVKLFKGMTFPALAKLISCKTLVFYGELEARKYPVIRNRSYITHGYISKSKLIEVLGSGHDVTSSSYIKAIKVNI